MVFRDRIDAGRQLADKMEPLISNNAMILAVPRGGVVVAAEIASRYGLEMDLIIPRKVGAPHNPEVAIGAVTQDGASIFNDNMVEMLGISEFELRDRSDREIEEIKRRMKIYRGSKDYPDCRGRQVIVVDDGVATGYTVFAALRSARNLEPSELVLAIPVAPPDTLELLKAEVDQAVCLVVPDNFYAVGQFYENFEQTSDEDVINIMKEIVKKKGIKKSPSPNNTLKTWEERFSIE